MKIRPAKEADLPSIIQLCKAHADFEKGSYSPEGKEEPLRKVLFSNEPLLYCLVVEDGEDIVGYATYMKQYSTWQAEHYIYLDCLYLKEEARGFGTGEEIMERIKDEAKKMGCSLIQWQTPDFNTRAIKFYKRIGGYSKSKERFHLDLE